ncbi:Pentatricopeptide repeat,Tetratricopeptide-like helical domain [Cinara cedri]|uniref:Pentatricopeptide repeat,Tetratricopeptide-like helical domain n=1 Tax=Cinara cedri TaxID=506608 RepID=A0A5E4M5C5_9HEMI|nr:Pentatricopeptide repeat,Tetratricopeptide-like helical domain [Cinara cedri]
MSVLIHCSKHIRSAYSLSRHRVSNNTLNTNFQINSHISRSTSTVINNGINTLYPNTNILPNRSFFTSTIYNKETSLNTIDSHIKQLDSDLRRAGRISKREIEEILKEIKTSKTATPSQSLMVLRCCGSLVPDELPENRTILAKELWNTINRIGVSLDISHYNTLLKVYLENNYKYSPTEFLEDLEKKGIAPNRVTFQHFITSYCQNGDIEGASRILEYMNNKQLPINKVVFNALVLGHSQNGDMESAEKVLNVMKESNLEPTSDTYTLLASGYAKKGDIAKVIEILDISNGKEIYISDREYLDIIYVLATNGHSNQIDQIITRIQKMSGYNQDAINCIYKLVIAGQEKIAFKLFDTMIKPLKPDGSCPPIGRFLIMHLIKVNTSFDNLIEFCNKLVSEQTNPKAFDIATEIALQNGSVDLALSMFEYLKKNEQPVRQHYFWPLFVAKSKQNDLKGLKNILSIMINEYNITPNIDTLRYYILPFMFKNNLLGAQIITDLQLMGVTTGTSAHAMVLYLLSKKEIRLAADIAATYRAFYYPSLLRQPLINAFLASHDVTSLIVILQKICSGLTRFSLINAPELAKQRETQLSLNNTEEQIIEMREFISQLINGIVQNLKQNSGAVQITQEILENLYEKGLGINPSAVEKVQNHLQGKITVEVSNLLESLTDSNLVPKHELSVKSSTYVYPLINESTLENIIKKAELSGDSKNNSKRQLLNLYCKNQNLEKASALKDKLIAEGFKIPIGSMVLLMELYLNNDKLAEAREIYENIKSNDPEFILDKYKVVKMAEVIAKIDSIENTIVFLSSLKKIDSNNEFMPYLHANTCWRLLNIVAESGNVENLQKVFDLLINNNYITVSNVLLGPLVKVHIIKNDLKEALAKFEWCCKTYRCTPWKNELAHKFIEAEDATSLQILTDLSTTVHGEINSLYDLMFSFIECGRIKQARKILETPGLRIRQDRINTVCAKYRSEGSEENLVRLLDVTKYVGAFDRTQIFNELLQLYSQNNKVKEAMALWIQMQEEDIQPTDNFMWELSELLKKNNLEVPFKVVQPKNINQRANPKNANQIINSQIDMLLKSDNINKALSLRKSILSKGSTINPFEESKIIEMLTRENRLEEAFEISKDMLNNSRPITQNIFNFLAGKLSESGDFASLEYLEGKVSKVVSQKLSLNSKIFKAYQLRGNANDLFVRLENTIDANINDSDKLSKIIKNVPGSGIINILKSDSSFVPFVERLNSKVISHGHIEFANSLWSYFMLNKEYEKALTLVKVFEDAKFIQYRYLLSEIRLNNNIEMAHKFLEILPSFKNIDQNKNAGLIYSAMIDSYVNQDNAIEASKILDKALEKITLNDLNETAVMRLKQLLKTRGEEFKYDTSSLQKKKTSSNNRNPEIYSDDSSDSSDDEKVAKV